MSDIVDNQQSSFRRLIMIPNLQQISSFGATTNDLGGILGLDVRCNLLNPWERALKRVLDSVMVLVIGILISPLLFLLGTLVKLDSKGSVFYGHTRIGKNRRKFKAWKFQTMVSDADQVLDAYLAQNPGLRAEWETTHKLKNDPRVTRLGSILRKFSLDELPQLWNVLRCEMSLVGPRPIVEDEVKHYATRFKLYTRVLPGITGMWQVSGRNDTTYEERVRLDEYYVRNWSIWLDIYILIRTIWVVMGRDGAY
ncbi:MAG: exopolysaccharide biosynthesis polyprenyl glycosylphosphotransferase [Anaerolineales bacterium]